MVIRKVPTPNSPEVIETLRTAQRCSSHISRVPLRATTVYVDLSVGSDKNNNNNDTYRNCSSMSPIVGIHPCPPLCPPARSPRPCRRAFDLTEGIRSPECSMRIRWTAQHSLFPTRACSATRTPHRCSLSLASRAGRERSGSVVTKNGNLCKVRVNGSTC